MAGLLYGKVPCLADHPHGNNLTVSWINEKFFPLDSKCLTFLFADEIDYSYIKNNTSELAVWMFF